MIPIGVKGMPKIGVNNQEKDDMKKIVIFLTTVFITMQSAYASGWWPFGQDETHQKVNNTRKNNLEQKESSDEITKTEKAIRSRLDHVGKESSWCEEDAKKAGWCR